MSAIKLTAIAATILSIVVQSQGAQELPIRITARLVNVKLQKESEETIVSSGRKSRHLITRLKVRVRFKIQNTAADGPQISLNEVSPAGSVFASRSKARLARKEYDFRLIADQAPSNREISNEKTEGLVLAPGGAIELPEIEYSLPVSGAGGLREKGTYFVSFNVTGFTSSGEQWGGLSEPIEINVQTNSRRHSRRSSNPLSK